MFAIYTYTMYYIYLYYTIYHIHIYMQLGRCLYTEESRMIHTKLLVVFTFKK